VRDRSGAKIECPVCQSKDIHYSNTSNFASFAMGMIFNADAVRCGACRHVFYKRTAAEDETEPEPKSKRR